MSAFHHAGRGRHLGRPGHLVFVIAATVSWASPGHLGSPVVAHAAGPSACHPAAGLVDRARGLLLDRYQLGAHPVVRLPHDLTWREDPFHDANWVFRLHSLEPVEDLVAATATTGDARFLARAIELSRDWAGDNVTARPPSPFTWNDHSTAMRAIRLTCLGDARPSLVAVTATGSSPWLRRLLVRHGALLADPDFYRREGNHALNQAIALLEVGRVVGRSDWRSLAARRIANLAAISIDRQGVTNEQAVGYQAYNWSRYTLAISRLRAAGISPSAALDRVQLMPGFLVHATMPNGKVEMLGDTSRTRGLLIPGTPNEYAATAGASGPRPARSVMRYDAGYLFARTGWGERRAASDETFLSLRFGPAPRFHGHADGGSITLYGYGTPLVIDPGLYVYGGQSTWRSWFKGRRAHNVVAVDGIGWRSSATALLDQATSPSLVFARVRSAAALGVTHTRSVVFSRALGYVLVEDRLASPAPHVYRQMWHLVEDAAPSIDGRSIRTHRDRGNVLIRQLATIRSVRVVKGAVSPIQGWVSYRYGNRIPAPVVETTVSGTTGRFLTLLVTGAGSPAATIGSLRLTATGYSVVVTLGGHSERVVVRGGVATITPLG
jgi:hypothetical protein